MLNLDSIFFGFKHKSVGNPPQKSHPKTNMHTQNDALAKRRLLKKKMPSLDIYLNLKNFWNQSICWEHVLDPSSIWRDPSCEALKMPALGVDWSQLGLHALASHAESDRSNVAAAPVASPPGRTNGGPGADDGKAVCFFWMHQSFEVGTAIPRDPVRSEVASHRAIRYSGFWSESVTPGSCWRFLGLEDHPS